MVPYKYSLSKLNVENREASLFSYRVCFALGHLVDLQKSEREQQSFPFLLGRTLDFSDVGGPHLSHRSEYALAGDMVNLAARLAAAAEKGKKEVLCDENTLKGLTGEVRDCLKNCTIVC